ncbi:MAG: alpha/beta fold hydrolase [Alphaproteobacteria bacterium]|nr:alpha/beta fold hydrolase [Alphaproteobacteria bacterium]
MNPPPPLPQSVLPPGLRARFVDDVNGLRMHVIEAGFEEKGRPCLLLLHGFPELGYSWRRVMPALAGAGFHVLAPDQRGYGRTSGWDGDYDGDLGSFRLFNLVRDAIGLIAALGHRSVAAIVGHDFGAPVAAWCALLRPDIFRAVALMSAPFAGPPPLPSPAARAAADLDIDAALAALPRPRKHYQTYYSTRGADAEMRHARQGIHAFLRAYFHLKSADWKPNAPHPLGSWSAEALAELPTYYVMDREKDIAQTVAAAMPPPEAVAACRWLPEEELAIYAAEFARTGFQGGLQWYRCATAARFLAELQIFSGRAIDVPSCFIAGASDWGVYQKPGAFEAMQETACSRMVFCRLIEGAGHWVQQERPDAVSRLLLDFLRAAKEAQSL